MPSFVSVSKYQRFAEVAVYILRVEEATLEAIGLYFSSTWIPVYQTPLHHIPEDRGLSIGGCENITSLMFCALECAIRHAGRLSVQL